MSFINEDQLEARLMSQFKGRVVMIAAAAGALGFALGALFL